MSDLNYAETLIAVADDCPLIRSEVPCPRGGRKTVAVLQYEMIAAEPYALTQEDVLFESWLSRQNQPSTLSAEREALRQSFFSKPQPCLRSSPLPKRYGWGLRFDQDGKVALCPMESEEYRRLVAGKVAGVTVLKALRSKRD
jgi:hypothetical protein